MISTYRQSDSLRFMLNGPEIEAMSRNKSPIPKSAPINLWRSDRCTLSNIAIALPCPLIGQGEVSPYCLYQSNPLRSPEVHWAKGLRFNLGLGQPLAPNPLDQWYSTLTIRQGFPSSVLWTPRGARFGFCPSATELIQIIN